MVRLNMRVAVLAAAMGLAGCAGSAGPAMAEAPGLRGLIGEQAVEIVVRLRPDAIPAMRGDAGARDAAGVAELGAALTRLGVALQPQHPAVSDPELASYFVASDVPAARAEEIAAALRDLAAVEAAYVKAPAAPP